jgi:hypothetical protein
VLLAAPFAQASGDIPAQNQAMWTIGAGLLMREL